ncbi:DMT family transporter [Leptobacterium sp. I13]|uniref:DMT family transporter n=1 Tax=Leptobacterium meishanense TaxID=3128904 RepID=UPI0030EB8627
MSVQATKWFYLILLSIIWGSSFILIKKALIGLSPYQLGALRILFTTFFLFSVGFGSLKKIKKKDWKWIAWSGYLGSFFPPFLFAIAQTRIDSAVASILNSLTPLNTFITGVLFYGVLVTKKQILGIILGLLGTVILIVSCSDINTSQNNWYSILIILASIGYALNVNMIKVHLEHLSAMSITAGTFLLIFFPALVILYTTGFFSTVASSSEMQIGLVYVVILSFFGTAMAKVVFNKLISISTPVFSSSVTYMMPLVAVLWGLLDGEKLDIYQLIGGVIIIVGVYLSNKKNRVNK